MKKYHMVARMRPQNRNDSSREFYPGQVVSIESTSVWVKGFGAPTLLQFRLADFRDRLPTIGDLVCYESWKDLVSSGWRIEVVS